MSYVANHNHTRSIAAKPTIECHIGGVHSNQIPDLKSNLGSLYVQQFGLEVCRNCCFVVSIKAVADKPIHYGSLADITIS